ncbi:hypothetical protein [Agromyces cerinus]|uniref:Uncharacterized protein n=1 Tax=Agromyces cerinus subsp. cerinus TaxID=232089 RepID=A0A1N6F2F8_9MICO|nr:hypothetical protein [Agromyces cerinus]SIN89444.1 hypothetical protein SAMN05443544_1679 [Agromyces cerinus subsp. cerinus]
MNARAFLIVPAVLVLGVLAGCGQTDGGAGAGTGTTRVKMPSTEVCHMAGYIRDRAPEGLCDDAGDAPATESVEGAVVVDDDLSPLSGR